MLTLTGKLTEANTLLTAWISEKILPERIRDLLAAATGADVEIARPRPLAMLLSNAVQPGPWPVITLSTSTVKVTICAGSSGT